MQIKARNKHEINVYVLLWIQFITIFYCSYGSAYGEEQKLQVLFNKQSKAPIASSTVDIDGNAIDEIVISEDGYLHIFEWIDSKFVEKWTSLQYSYVLPGSTDNRVKNMSLNYVSTVFPAQYKLRDVLKKAFFFYAQPVQKKSDLYELSFHDGNYSVQKRLEMLSSVWSPHLICDDKTTTLLGKKSEKGKDQIAAYAWNGKEMNVKWLGLPGSKGALPGQLFITPAQKKKIVLLLGSENSILYCDGNQYYTKAIGKISEPFPGYNDGHSVVGITKKKSHGELWTIETPNVEGAFFYKLYMSQFDGAAFSPFNKVDITGINTDRVSAISIVDLDNDGVGEIIGSEVTGTLMASEEGEGPELKGERSYIFAAKWNGKEYAVMWRQLAADSTLRRIAVDDITGDGKKEIIAEGYSLTKNQFSLYVFTMPPVRNDL